MAAYGRERVARVMAAAQASCGSREALAQRLGVAAHLVGEWIAQWSDCPEDTVNHAVEIILDQQVVDEEAVRRG